MFVGKWNEGNPQDQILNFGVFLFLWMMSKETIELEMFCWCWNCLDMTLLSVGDAHHLCGGRTVRNIFGWEEFAASSSAGLFLPGLLDWAEDSQFVEFLILKINLMKHPRHFHLFNRIFCLVPFLSPDLFWPSTSLQLISTWFRFMDIFFAGISSSGNCKYLWRFGF